MNWLKTNFPQSGENASVIREDNHRLTFSPAIRALATRYGLGRGGMESILTERRADRIGPDESGTLHRDGFQASPFRLREVRQVAAWETIAVRRRAEIMASTVLRWGQLRVGVVA